VFFCTKKKHLTDSLRGYKEYLANQWIASKVEWNNPFNESGFSEPPMIQELNKWVVHYSKSFKLNSHLLFPSQPEVV